MKTALLKIKVSWDTPRTHTIEQKILQHWSTQIVSHPNCIARRSSS